METETNLTFLGPLRALCASRAAILASQNEIAKREATYKAALEEAKGKGNLDDPEAIKQITELNARLEIVPHAQRQQEEKLSALAPEFQAAIVEVRPAINQLVAAKMDAIASKLTPILEPVFALRNPEDYAERALATYNYEVGEKIKQIIGRSAATQAYDRIVTPLMAAFTQEGGASRAQVIIEKTEELAAFVP